MSSDYFEEIKYCGMCVHEEKLSDAVPCRECILKGYVNFRNKHEDSWREHIHTKDHHPYFKEKKKPEK